MIYVLALGLVALLVLGYITFERDRAFTLERDEWTKERRELLNRIQAPGRIPVGDQPEFVIPEREPDDWNQVGQIVIDPRYGLEPD